MPPEALTACAMPTDNCTTEPGGVCTDYPSALFNTMIAPVVGRGRIVVVAQLAETLEWLLSCPSFSSEVIGKMKELFSSIADGRGAGGRFDRPGQRAVAL